MNLVALVIVVFTVEASLADRCETADILNLLVSAIQRNRQSFQSSPGSNAGTVGPKGDPGPQGAQGLPGPPGTVDMKEVEKRIQQMIDENREYLMRQGEMCYLGMKSRAIPNSAVSASSYYAKSYEPHRGRLDNQLEPGNIGAWAVKTNAVGQWLQIDLGRVRQIAGIITQGRPTDHQWVTSYKVACGAHSGGLSVIRANGIEKVFAGNGDHHTKVYNRFPQVHSCRYVRIYPQSWHGHTSMRVELVSGACFNYSVPW